MSDQDHTYPSAHGPGTFWATDVAWSILDALPPGRLDGMERAYLSGLIAGALVRYVKNAEDGRPPGEVPIEPAPRLT